MVTLASELPAYRIILQARTTSTRLPAKVLLPVAGQPLAVLAAKRVGRNGAEVVVATSVGVEDDLLTTTLADAGLSVVRGPLENVLERFLIATQDLSDTAICVRLTADNPCPDADFVETLVRNFMSSGSRYLAYGNDAAWLPYGLSAEMFYVADLRAAAHNADPYIQEHVTPSIRANYAPEHRLPFPDWPQDHGHVRCTVDTLQDYLFIADLFQNEADPIAVSYRTLAARMIEVKIKPVPALILGTAQLGLPYGVTKDVGLMSSVQARGVLTALKDTDCGGIDTARAYGESEVRIGGFLADAGSDLPIVTKLSPIDVENGLQADIKAAVEASINASLHALGVQTLETVLLHRAEHITAADGAIWDRLRHFQQAGQITRLGVSVQTPQELEAVLALPEVQHIQLPFNVLDERWAQCVSNMRTRPDVVVHVRSVFLQGLLVQPDVSRWPSIEGVDTQGILDTLTMLVAHIGREGVMDLCIAYVRAFSWVDGVVMGVDTEDQLHELSALFAKPALTWEEVFQVRQALPRLPECLLNPARW